MAGNNNIPQNNIQPVNNQLGSDSNNMMGNVQPPQQASQGDPVSMQSPAVDLAQDAMPVDTVNQGLPNQPVTPEPAVAEQSAQDMMNDVVEIPGPDFDQPKEANVPSVPAAPVMETSVSTPLASSIPVQPIEPNIPEASNEMPIEPVTDTTQNTNPVANVMPDFTANNNETTQVTENPIAESIKPAEPVGEQMTETLKMNANVVADNQMPQVNEGTVQAVVDDGPTSYMDTPVVNSVAMGEPPAMEVPQGIPSAPAPPAANVDFVVRDEINLQPVNAVTPEITNSDTMAQTPEQVPQSLDSALANEAASMSAPAPSAQMPNKNIGIVENLPGGMPEIPAPETVQPTSGNKKGVIIVIGILVVIAIILFAVGVLLASGGTV